MSRCALYRHFDGDGGLLYVGASVNPIARLAQHVDSLWFYDIASVTIGWHPTVEAALAAEYEAIQRERPLHNRLHSVAGVRRTKPATPRPVATSRAGIALRGWLTSNGKTQMDLARDISLNQSTISKLMAGKIQPSIGTALEIQDYTGGEVSSSSWATQ